MAQPVNEDRLAAIFAKNLEARPLPDPGPIRHPRDGLRQAAARMVMGPSTAGVACALLFERGRRAVALGIGIRPNWWWFGAYGLGIAFSAVSLAATISIGHGAIVGPSSVPLFALSALVINPIVQMALAILAEELGWRGYLYGVWRRLGFWRCSLATGLVWGVWHAPGIVLFKLNYPDYPWIGAAIFVPFCVLAAPLMTLLRDRGGSVIAAGVFHGTVNATDIAIMMLAKSASPLWQGNTGIGGFIAVVLCFFLVVLFRRGNNDIQIAK